MYQDPRGINIVEVTKNSKEMKDKLLSTRYDTGRTMSRMMSDYLSGNIGGGCECDLEGHGTTFTITKIEESTEDGGTNVITFSDGSVLKVRNGNKGKDGTNGTNGKDGTNGTSITITKLEESTTDGGSNIVTFSDGKTLIVKNGNKGKDGTNGKDGTSVTILSVEGATEDGEDNIVNFSDGNTLKIKNGSKGSKGDKGDPGDTPVKGVDYFTEADKQEIIDAVLTALNTETE